MNELVQKLYEIRNYSGRRVTEGLSDEIIETFLDDKDLQKTINTAFQSHRSLQRDYSEELQMDEQDLCILLQKDYENFYPEKTRSPFVALSAFGPWIVTSHGGVLHDSAGYGMLGMGHSSSILLESMSKPWVMANVMTPQFSQKRFADLLKKEIGHTKDSCPFSKFICMNSGSEAVSVAARICDIQTKKIMEKAENRNKKVKQLSLQGGFHGRTYRAAKVSDSTGKIYRENLYSFSDIDDLIIVPPNDLTALKEIYKNAADNNIFIEAFYMEPVMGEGVSGLAITPEFYNLARRLTSEHGSMLIVDSIQAALRAQGVLSIIDYPGFENCEAPDCETYSKALNAGQYPLSVVALTKKFAELYVPGVYGNTMTTNPRALEVGCEVLENITPEIRKNIVEKGREFKTKLQQLADEYPEAIESVIGTGLIVNAELNKDKFPVVAENGFEYYLRTNGINMIHGGDNGIRFTPHFAITSKEIDLIISTIREGIIQLS
ncbi:MAG: aminotransferase class III-fold pyridoxal phosphate-dependent enzyme [Candidatus Cloacimonetes bacterium]|nr:aminotransferase class III-fold pyridoxal phosphate-dependent enzyme [Candidatus Cloacimonadota bacterium]MCF7815055.1 aminotransferase class III-fold pyridoxal phosphate-dependent enzyme [Candidatus Cloacimonadota bacterium]MCF7868552.1 aminotransferase class III-fold pyridoxal phosphate-dependent enzyme [Candidatus Cloacimonadota bacterium]MCF7884264.1 aminotransferase class III-fold pyridoxal phosphate-dependent enzyme [Candidatus Cloacimonadota bacterium]